MPQAQIDYTKLAAQARTGAPPATPPTIPTAPVDYGALAQQARTTQAPAQAGAPPAPPSTWQLLKEETPKVLRTLLGGTPYTGDDAHPKLISGEAAAGTAGAMAASAAVTAAAPEVAAAAGAFGAARMIPAAWRWGSAAAGVVGAGAGGAAHAAATGGDIGNEAAAQATAEAGGRILWGGASAVGRRFLGSRVGRYAKDALAAGRDTVNEQLNQILAQAQAAVRGNKQGLTRSVAAQAAGVDAAKATGEQSVAQAAGRWPGGPPPPAPTQQVLQVMHGPAKHSLDQLGEAVGKAAESGPPVPTAALRARLADLSAQTTPSVLQNAATTGATTGASAEARALVSQGYARDVAQAEQILTRNPDTAAALGQIPPELHLPAALAYANRVVSTGETIPFADAHKVKRLLDDVVNWDRAAKKIRESATKGFRQTLRSTMAGHAPYDQATTAYAATRPLFNVNYAAGLAKRAIANPDSLVISMAKQADQPVPMQMLHDVLTLHAERGGGAEGRTAGQEAWNAVRAAVTHKKFIQGGIEKFDATLAKAHPEWIQTLYGDAEGRQVIQNLQQISAAYRQAQATADRSLATARATLKDTNLTGAVRTADLASAKAQTAEQVRQAKRPTPTEQKFKASSLVSPPTVAQTGTDIAHTLVRGHSIFKLGSMVRLWTDGPKLNDLIEWAAYSPQGTKKLVAAFTSQQPGAMLAILARQAGLEGSATEGAEGDDLGGPPPGLAPVPAHGGPPPGPR